MRRRTAISLLSCALALAVAGCGSDGGTIPEEEGQGLLSLLDATESAVTNGDCERAEQFAGEFVEQTRQLPSSVDSEVAEELTTAGENLEQLAADPTKCTPGTSGVTGEQPDEEVQTGDPETTDVTEEPETTEEPTTTEEPEEPEQPAEEPAQEEPANPPAQQPPANPSDNANPDGGLEPPSGGVGAGGGAG